MTCDYPMHQNSIKNPPSKSDLRRENFNKTAKL
jgi:hypothetical protein